MNAAHAICRLEEAGFSHQQATGVVEVIQGDVIDNVATRLRRRAGRAGPKELAEQIGALRQELATRSAPCGVSSPRAERDPHRADARDQPPGVLD